MVSQERRRPAGLPVLLSVVLGAVTAAGIAGCGGARQATAAGGTPTATALAAPATAASGRAATATPPAPASPASSPASLQAFGKQVFSFAQDNTARLKSLTVIPASVAGTRCVSVYSNRGYAIAAKTQDADMRQVPPAGTPTAMVSACERHNIVTQIATDNVDAKDETAVLDAQYPTALTTLGHANPDGSDLRTTHHASQAQLLTAAAAAFSHLESLLGSGG